MDDRVVIDDYNEQKKQEAEDIALASARAQWEPYLKEIEEAYKEAMSIAEDFDIYDFSVDLSEDVMNTLRSI